MDEAGTIQDMLTMHDFYMIDAKVDEVARALGLLDLGLDKDVTDLSGGQRTKVLMGKLLLEKPDILLLDEPTNYLDEEHIEWLKRYLQDYENAFILISHDIPFLNSVVNLIYHMDNKKLDRYVGDYDQFQEVYEVKKAQLEAAYNKQQQEIKELKDFVARNKARVATRNMAMSRQKKLDKMDVIELAFRLLWTFVDLKLPSAMSHTIHKIVSKERCQSYFISRRSPHLGIKNKDSELCASAHRCLHYAYARLIARVTFHLFQLPDISVVLCNSSVGGEESGLGDVH